MGWETAVTTGFSALTAAGKMAQGQATSDAFAREGEQRASLIADNTARTIGKLQTSFLHSGIALDDVGGTQAVIGEASKQGLTDVSRTIDNYNNQSKNSYNSARTAALEGLIKTAGSTSLPSDAGSWLNDKWNSAGQDVGSWLDPSPTGPYLPFGMSRS